MVTTVPDGLCAQIIIRVPCPIISHRHMRRIALVAFLRVLLSLFHLPGQNTQAPGPGVNRGGRGNCRQGSHPAGSAV